MIKMCLSYVFHMCNLSCLFNLQEFKGNNLQLVLSAHSYVENSFDQEPKNMGSP